MSDKQVRDPRPPSLLAPGVPADLERLCLALLARDPAARPDVHAIRAQLGSERVTHNLPRPPAGEALGRDEQLRALEAAWQQLAHVGRPVVVRLRGASGMGKSTLLDRFFAGLVTTGRARVLAGKCHERESVPFKALDGVMDALCEQVRGMGTGALDGLDASHVRVLAQLFPGLAEIARLPAAPSSGEPAQGRQMRRRAATALAALFAHLAARQPLVLGIDDAQWGDLDSMHLLIDALRVEATPLLVVTSYREDVTEHAPAVGLLENLQLELAGRISVIDVPLSALGDDDARALALAWLEPGGEAALARVDEVCREAEGSPFLIAEMARQVLEAPRGEAQQLLSFDTVLRRRVEALDPTARLVFDAVCVAGRPVRQVVVARAASSAASLDPVVKRLRVLRLLRMRSSHGPDALDVFHDQLRERARGLLDPATLGWLHRALAEAHEALDLGDAEALATHFQGAGELRKARDYALQAAEAAAAALAFDRAAALLKQALALTDPGKDERALRLRLAEVLSDAGRGSEAAPLYMKVAEDAPFEEALELRRRAAEQCLVSGRTEEGLAALEQVLSAVSLRLPRTQRAAWLDLLATRTALRLRGLRFVPRAEAEVPKHLLLRIDACKGSWALSFVNTIQGAAFQAKYLWLALQAGEPYRIALGLGMEAIHTSSEGQRRARRVERLQREARRQAGRIANPHAHAFMDLMEGQSHYMFGRWRASSEALERAEQGMVQHGRNVTWELSSSRFFWGNALVLLGRWRELRDRLERWLLDAEDRNDVYAYASLRLLGTRSVDLARDDAGAAREGVRTSLAAWSSREFGVQQFLAEMTSTQLDLYERDGWAAYGRMRALWPAFSRSLMTRIQLCRIQALYHQGLALLAVLGQTPRPRRSSLRRAQRIARRLRAERTPWADPFADYIEAVAAYHEDAHETAVARLRRAASGFAAADMPFYAAAVRWRLGERLGGAAGDALCDAAEAVFRAQGVLRPDKLRAMMAPGL